MKNLIIKGLALLFAGCPVLLGSCDDYLNEKPKGKTIPETLADFEAMLRYEYGAYRYDVLQANYLMGDQYCNAGSLSYYPLYRANYNWDTSINRVEWNNSDETAYYQGYGNISVFNLVMDYAPSATEATDEERQTVYAYAQALRAMAYFQLVNYYADTYDPATASQTGGVPKITSSEVGAPYVQESVQAIYDFMVSEVEAALPSLPDKGVTILHPGKGACYAFLSRVYLQMMNYDKALEYAEKALAVNSELYDWTAFYAEHEEVFTAEGNYTAVEAPMGFSYVENYNFTHGSTSYSSSVISLPEYRGEAFEEGDARFLSCWKLRDYGGGTCYYYPMVTGYINYGGMKTAEVYLIKAECLARQNRLNEAMKVLDEVRVKRILPEFFRAREAFSVAEAVGYIWQTKRNELIGSIMPFADARRLNREGLYPVTLTKVIDGERCTLAPDSYLWIMPFPQGAIENPGNGSLMQNVDK